MYLLNINLTVEEVAEALDIYEASARELLEGVIPWELDELVELARYKGVSFGVLMLHRVWGKFKWPISES